MTEMQYPDRLAALWSKSDRKDPQHFHLLHYHLIDTAAVALKLWELALSHSVREDVANCLGGDVQAATRQIAFWTALHDIGKASPVFQGILPDQARVIRQTGLEIEPNLDPKRVYHSQVSGRFLREHELAPIQVDIAISGHHGQWNADYDFSSRYYGGKEWDKIRLVLAEMLQEITKADLSFAYAPANQEEANCFSVWLSGFITVSDWVASNETYFSYRRDLTEPYSYFYGALENAATTLHKLGWLGWRPQGKAVTFLEMYPWMKQPRRVQSEIIQVYEDYSPIDPFLAIIEAPTGIGKTETAFYLADRWLQQTGGSGLYIAMPTQATSNQIYQRSLEILADRYPEDLIPITLAHGQAAWNERVNAIRVKEVGERHQDLNVLAAEWFQNNRKRTLLTPFGVGTVDQAFLSILQTRHFFVRLFGLKDKVVMFDEVHAYDAYMNELFYRLLSWLRGMGTAVVILSATLPDEARRRIAAAYNGWEAETIPTDTHYPRLTFSSTKQGITVTPLTPPEERTLALNWLEPGDLEQTLRQRLESGGCAAVICNTVGKAQKIYLRLSAGAIVPEEDLILFHARFPAAWRREKEALVLSKFGKGRDGTVNNKERPEKAIVIATQVIEQSLDLDFDLMITELAPVDLILQRAGRLHRHAGRVRPGQLKQPELLLLKPEMEEESFPDFGASRWIYDYSTLWKTWRALRDKNELHTLRDTRSLIETVYGLLDEEGMEANVLERLKALQREELKEMEKTRKKARSILVPGKGDERLLYAASLNLKEDDNPELHASYRALTRDIGPSLTLLCLHQGEDGGLHLEPDCSGAPLDLTRLYQDYGLLKKVLQMAINIQQPRAIASLLKDDGLIRLKDIPALRYSFIAPFRNGTYASGRIRLSLDRHSGLQIEHE